MLPLHAPLIYDRSRPQIPPHDLQSVPGRSQGREGQNVSAPPKQDQLVLAASELGVPKFPSWEPHALLEAERADVLLDGEEVEDDEEEDVRLHEQTNERTARVLQASRHEQEGQARLGAPYLEDSLGVEHRDRARREECRAGRGPRDSNVHVEHHLVEVRGHVRVLIDGAPEGQCLPEVAVQGREAPAAPGAGGPHPHAALLEIESALGREGGGAQHGARRGDPAGRSLA
mmetsp:Transcript_7052/g.17528  ORF Transcript_7052/g.17528 Transcript_7052/m.17528 type:complete len:230 (-) Transcript_7052:120-809(-)